jgi:DNA-binding NarL/FixJ family response regulator
MQQKILKVPNPGLDLALRILIVGREAMNGYLLAEALGKYPEYDPAAVSPPQLLPAISSRKTNLVVISADLHARPGHGMVLAKTVNRSYPEIPIILVLDQPEREEVIGAFRAGARGVFSRLQSMAEFHACIEHVRQGGLWAGHVEADYLLEALRSIPAPNPHTAGNAAPLTRRESQVVSCAAQGKTNKSIAQELGLSEHTVKNYLFRAFDKLGVSSRVELLFYLTTHGHLSSPASFEGFAAKPVRNLLRKTEDGDSLEEENG